MATKEYHQEYYRKNKERLMAQQKAYYHANRELVRQQQRAAYLKRCEADPTYRTRMLERSRQSKLRRQALDRAYHKSRWGVHRYQVMLFVAGEYGIQCRRCGFDEYPALQIDHVHGGGRSEIRQFKDNRKYLEHIKKNPAAYQILCANCNWLKKYERNENPNKKDAITPQVENGISQAQGQIMVPVPPDKH